MPIFDIKNERFTFIHVPKTGGSSIEDWLHPMGRMTLYSRIIPSFLKITPQHFTVDNMTLLGLPVNDKTFCIVRDPYDRAESEYSYQHRNLDKALWPEFSEWMLRHLQAYSNNKHHLDNHFLPQSYFFNETSKVLQFEDGFESIFSQLAEYLDVELPAEKIHSFKSDRGNLTWTHELIDRFNTVYACDFDTLNYTKKTMSHIDSRNVEN